MPERPLRSSSGKPQPSWDAEPAAALRRAADQYEKEAGLLASAYGRKDAFLGPWSGKTIADWTPAVRKREQEILSQARELEAQGVAEIEAALKAEGVAVPATAGGSRWQEEGSPMTAKKALTSVALLGAACLGGAVAQWVVCGRTAHAQEKAPAAQAVRAQSFVLVDAQGKERGTLRVLDEGPQLVLKDAEGRPRLVLGQVVDEEGSHWSLALRDDQGHSRFACGVPDS